MSAEATPAVPDSPGPEVTSAGETPRLTGTTEVGTAQAGTTEAGTAQAGTTEAGTAQAGTTEAGTAQAGTTEAGTAQAATAQAEDAWEFPWASLGDRARDGIAATGHGLAFFGLAPLGLALSLLILALTLPGPGLVAYGLGQHHNAARDALVLALPALCVSLFLASRLLLAIRPLAGLTRRLSGRWCGVPIADPYLPRPGADGRKASLGRRLIWPLTDQATWRDLLWAIVNGCVGWLPAVLPAGLLALGVFGVIAPYAALDERALAIVAAAAGLWAAPWLLRGYGYVARSMLAPTRQAELALRVSHLAQTRTEALDTGAAEIRRIERDLHDGAQARLVAMGMTLDAAGQIIDTNPEAARALLYEARDASVKALAELRALVRGIHPPVLADRGLGDAIQALALDTPMRIHLVSDLYGRPSPPIESAAYFAVSELLANVSKHAEARQTWIDIRHTDGMLRIGVTDNGHGGADPGSGSGLRGIERRLAAFDGVLAISSPPGGPTAVTMEIPCELSLPKTSSS
jgi:signal transduction histidine kinase